MPINPLQQQAIDAIERGESILLCGRAGTGKSFTLNHWAEHTEKKHVLLAPTGVAAVHLGGQTIHSFFGIAPGALPNEVATKANTLPKNKKAIIKAIETLVIDEISMVRADLLDCIDITLRIVLQNDLPFGGKPLVLVGDMYQLPPVVQANEQQLFCQKTVLHQGYEGPYFFYSHAFSAGFFPRLIHLSHSFRQQGDQQFLTLLNAIRNRSISQTQLEQLNQQLIASEQNNPDTMYLTGTNRRANEVNQMHLDQLTGKTHTFTASQWGQVDSRSMPVEETLRIKVGARVMVARNDQPHLGRWVNGTTGNVSGFYTETSIDGQEITGARVRKDKDGIEVKIAPCSWEVYRYVLRDNRIERELVGAFTQIPLRLAWALTIHKAQGKTFNNVTIDPSTAAFAHGQVYVALSRCTHLAGIQLTRPLRLEHILLDTSITRFMASYQLRQARLQQSEQALQDTITSAIQNQQPLSIDYLERSDEPSRLEVMPEKLGTIDHKGTTHLCLTATIIGNTSSRFFNLARLLKAHPSSTATS